MPLERLTDDLVVEIAREFPTLSNLNLSKNAIREIDCDFSLLRHVNRLNLSHNQLDDLPATLHAHLPQLTQLLLAHNKFTSLQSLQSLKTITHLDLSANAIDHLDQLDYLKDLPLLSDLSLHGNPKLDALDSTRRLHILRRLPQLQTLDQEPVRPQEREQARRFSVATSVNQPLTSSLPPAFRLPLPSPLTNTSPLPRTPVVSTPSTPPQLLHFQHLAPSTTSLPPSPPPSNSTKQLELMQHRIHALQEILTLQETELSHAVVSATARKQLSHVTPDPPSMYQKLLAKWRTKVFEMVVAAKCQDMASHELGQQAARSVHIMETRVADHVRHIQSLTQRLADADAAARLLHLQLDQLHADRTTLQSKCQRHVATVESERQRMREMAHHVIASVQDNGMVQRLQHMYTRLTDHEQRLRRQVQHAESLVVCLARKEARLRNQEAAWEGERRVWIKRLQGANVADTNTGTTTSSSTTTGKPATTLPTKAKSSFRLKPESEHVLRAVFHRVDPYQTGLAPTKRFIAALQKDWTVRQELGAAGVDKLMAVMSHSPLFGVTKHVTWGEFVLLFLPDLSPLPKDAPVVDNVPESSDGVPVPFDEEGSKVTKPALTLPLNLDEWTRDQLECHVVHLEQERARLVGRVKEDASELQRRVRVVQQQWHVKCDAQVQSMAALQDTIRDLERTLALQTNAHAHVETQLAEVRAQSATADSAWRNQVRELELKLDSVSREHDKAMARLEEAHAMALQDAALQVRQAQKDQAKQDVYIRQLERQLKRLQDSAVAQEKDELQALARQLEKRDVEITKLRRERNALLTTLREQEKAPSPIMVDQGTDLPELFVATVETSDKVTTPAIQLQTPRKPQTAAPPATRSVPPPTSLSHRISALSSQANRWLTDDDDWAHDDV